MLHLLLPEPYISPSLAILQPWIDRLRLLIEKRLSLGQCNLQSLHLPFLKYLSS